MSTLNTERSEILQPEKTAAVAGNTASEASAPLSPEDLAAKKKKDRKKEALEWVKDIGIAVVCAFVLLQFIQPTIVREHSMQNTLQENDYLFVSKQSYKLFGGTPKTGDIIVFKSALTTANGTNKLLIKRVVGVGGDTVRIAGGKVFLNGKELAENYTKDGVTLSEMEEVTVPDGYLFAMGDNRQNSADSRDSRVGFVPEDMVVGKAVLRLFPISGFGGLYD